MIEGRNNRGRQTLARRPLYAACFLALTAWGGIGPVHAQSSEAPRVYAIDAGTLEGALNQLSRQSQVQIVFRPDLVAGKRAAAISGQLTWRQALERLLLGSGLEYRQVADKTIVIQASEPRPAPASKPAETRKPAPAPAARADAPVADLERLTVTGTRIRGGTTPSPIITIGSDNIREEGFNDLGEVMRALPQNFSGGQNPGVASLGYSGGGIQNQNITGGSSPNLRGLGPDATLTLLNGRRMAFGGLSQVVDISAIPVEAVDRIEIVADGASAIYGSDAVGGVTNVILRRDFDGAALGARYGTATDGGLTTREYTATAGSTWTGGGLITTYRNASVDPIYARQRDYTAYLTDPMTLYPGIDEDSVLLSAHQSLGNVAEIHLDAFRTKREQLYNLYAGGNTNVRATPDSTTSLVAPSIDFFLPNDWTLSIGGAWSKNELIQTQDDEQIGTGEITYSTRECLCHESRIYELGAEGPLFRLPGGDARLAAGAGYRTNDYRHENYTQAFTYARGDESSRFAYLELHLPLIGEDSGASAAKRLELTAALRREDYDSFGGVNNPKLGIVYGPNPNFTLKASWGKSFKAPTLHQRYYFQAITLDPASRLGGVGYGEDATALSVTGGNPNLGPERARSWTASLAFHPEAFPGLESEVTWFDIDYTNRAVEPVASFFQSLSNPAYAQFVDYTPTEQEQAALIAAGGAFYNRIGVPYDPNDVIAIVYARYVNVARQRIRGLDLSASYRLDVGSGRLVIRGAGSWLDSSQQTTPGQGSFDLAGTLNNPPKFTSRLGAVWTQGGFTASAFANYKAGVLDTVEHQKTASFTTFDATLRYAIPHREGPWSGLEFSLAAQNLFDRAPPLQAAWFIYAPPYDTTNYSAVGRFLSISVEKRW